MRKILLLILLPFLPFLSFGQKVDTVIKTKIYKSYFSYHYCEPLYVSYKLYNGGGDCSRESFSFYNDTKIKTSTDKDYSHSGYDKGHLANSEDFANDCKKDEMTFRYYNCLPQTPNLNRGIWKHWETVIREESKSDSLLVICGGVFSNKKMGNVYVPDFCWKIVKSLSTGKIKHVLWFTNAESNSTCQELSLADLQKKLKYKPKLIY